MKIEIDLLPENIGKLTVNEEVVFIHNFKNYFIVGKNELVQHI